MKAIIHRKSQLKLLFMAVALVACSLPSIGIARADSKFALVPADVVPKEKYPERVPVPPEERHEKPTPVEEPCGWGGRLSPGITVWFFNEEDTNWGPSGFLDIYKDCYPVNFRVGVEGVHMDVEQEGSESFAERPGKDARISFIRIPFALEYRAEIDEHNAFFFGGGPDILHTANDNTDTNVGLHLGVRYALNFTKHWGVAVEGGYMWGYVDSSGGNITLDTAYITPTFTYTF